MHVYVYVCACVCMCMLVQHGGMCTSCNINRLSIWNAISFIIGFSSVIDLIYVPWCVTVFRYTGTFNYLTTK